MSSRDYPMDTVAGQVNAAYEKQQLMAQRETVRQRLMRRREDTVRQLADYDAAIALFDANPAMENVIEALQRVGMYN